MEKIQTINIIRTGWSADHIFNAEQEKTDFSLNHSPVLNTIKRIMVGRTDVTLNDLRICGVNSDNLTSDLIREVISKVCCLHGTESRIIITSGTWALSQIGKALNESWALRTTAQYYYSVPRVVQVAAKLPWYLWTSGDLTTQLIIAFSLITSTMMTPWTHAIVVWWQLISYDELKNNPNVIDLPEEKKVIV